MISLRKDLEHLLQQAITQAFGAEAEEVAPEVSRAANPQHGDYQANFAMKLAKKLNMPPREVAQKVAAKLGLPSCLESVEVAGPGFINLTMKDHFLEALLIERIQPENNLGILPAQQPKKVVVDYGGANVAKEMHIGHLRSPVLGDAMVRFLESVGHTVIRQNHLGDWGTQFGMLIEHLADQHEPADKHHDISTLNALYQAAKKRYDTQADFAQRARERLVKLQSGDTETKALWQRLREDSRQDFQEIYTRLGLTLTPEADCGESFYNAGLQPMIDALLQQSKAVRDEGAVVIPLEGFEDKDNKPVPFLIQKSDGGFLYATTDLAALAYRANELQAEQIVYVVDARQRQHFAMLFASARKTGLVGEDIQLEHKAFGSILGPDKKPFKTRSGESVKLREVLNEAQARAYQLADNKNPELAEEEKQHIATVIGIGAIKYADLANDLGKDYSFDWSRLLAFEGNSAPYLINAYVRTQAIFRKYSQLGVSADEASEGFIIEHPKEHQLALELLQFGEVVSHVSEKLTPHKMCNYLCDLAAVFHSFYEHCPVLKAENDLRMHARIQLCQLTASILARGLALLGIDVLDRM